MIKRFIANAVVFPGVISIAGYVLDSTQLYIDPTDLDDFDSVSIDAASTATGAGASLYYVHNAILGHVIEVPSQPQPGLSGLLYTPLRPLK